MYLLRYILKRMTTYINAKIENKVSEKMDVGQIGLHTKF